MNDNFPTSEVFLLFPENERVIQGQSKLSRNEAHVASLQKVEKRLRLILALYLILTAILWLASPNSHFVVLLVGFIPAVIISVLLFLLRRRYKCLKTLEATGKLLPGKVVDAKKDNAVTRNGVKSVLRLRYEFMSPQGKRFEREEAQLRDSLDLLPETGTPVVVMYAGDDCFHIL